MTNNNINSEQFAENDFHLYWNLALRRKWMILGVTVITVTLTAIASFKAKHVYRATAQLLIEKEYASSPYREEVAVDISGMDYYQTQYKIIKSRNIAKKVINTLGLNDIPEFKVEKGDPVEAFLRYIIVEPIRGSRLVNLSAESNSPELAAKITNTLADDYVTQNLENRLFASREVLRKLPANISIDKLSNKDIMESLPSVINNPLIQSLKTELIKYEAEYANLSKRYKAKYPEMITLRARIDSLTERLNAEMHNTVESIKTELSGEFKANNVRIVYYAEVPDSPIRPKRKQNIILALILGFAAGLCLAFFFEYLDNTIQSGSDIRKYLNLPFLGIVPLIKENSVKELDVENLNTLNIETVKSIRTNLVFSAPEGKLKTILITSCSPNEGKTFVSANLALSFSHAGKKTLLVDSDLRRSALTKFMKVGSEEGLSSYLTGQAGLDAILRPSKIQNLTFITTGTHPPNPAELLGSEKMKEFIEQVKNRFDRIIFDSAPVLAVSDTLNISSLMDGIVLVIDFGKISRSIANMGIQKLHDVNAKIIGAVLNRVNIKSAGYNEYNYYYSYGNKY